MGTITLVRPDGSTLNVDDQDAQPLLSLGYKEQSVRSEFEGQVEQGRQDYYDQPWEKVKTLGEGALSGATLGLSNLADNSTFMQERAQYNPGYRLAGEVMGSFAVPGLGELGEGVNAGVEALGGGRALQGLARGTVEGGLFGAGNSISQAEINGDPITAESILAGTGWGAVFGGGLGAFTGAVAGKLEARAAAKLESASAEEGNVGAIEKNALDRAKGDADVHSVLTEGLKNRNAALDTIEEHHYGEFRGALEDVRKQVKDATDVMQEQVTGSSKIALDALKKSKSDLYNYLADSGNIGGVREASRGVEKAFSEASKAAEAGDFKAMNRALDKFKGHVEALDMSAGSKFAEFDKLANHVSDYGPSFSQLVGQAKGSVEGLQTYGSSRIKAALAAGEEGIKLKAIAGAMDSLPRDAEAFRGMTSQRVEKLSGALDSLMSSKSAELAGLKSSVQDAVEKLSDQVGIKADGVSVGDQFRKLQSTLKGAGTSRALEHAKAMTEGKALWGKVNSRAQMYENAKSEGISSPRGNRRGGTSLLKNIAATGAGIAGESAAESAGAKGLGKYAAFKVSKDIALSMMGLKGAVLGKIGESVEKWAPRVNSAVQKASPRWEPLVRRIDGTRDDVARTKSELMKARAQEIRDAGPSVKDTLYKSIAPLGGPHPDLASAMHDLAVQQFSFILDKLPKDPGGAYSAFKTLWSPDPTQIAKFERYYAVFQDPVGEIDRALSTGKVTPELVEGLKEMNPELYQELRGQLLDKMSDPLVWKHMSYSEQVNMGLLMDIPVHSTMRGKFIAAQQQMFTERTHLNKQPMNPQPGAGGSGGPNQGATAAQKTTEH